MTYEQRKILNDILTEITGVKHYPAIDEMFASKFEELGEVDDNGKKIRLEKRD